MSTCPTNPVVDVPSSRDTSNSCGKIRDIKAQPSNNNNMTQKETFAYLMRNPPLNRSCDDDGGDVIDTDSDSDDEIFEEEDEGNDPIIIFTTSNPKPTDITFDYITGDMNTIADKAMKLVSQELLLGASETHLSQASNRGGNVCHYKPIKF
tara:strand:- start:159 stop:611 length:453 start_codon:yes stop_codon:yes gene_type:complete